MRLVDYIQEIEESGELWFDKADALSRLGCSKDSLKQSIYALVKKKRLAPIRGNFVVIIPYTYKSWGIIPANHFVDPLMKSLELPYYVSTLSAAQYHGAAHQKPQQFQVVTDQYVRDIKYERIHIRFLQNNRVASIPTERKQVRTGYIQVSTPEATALDVCKFYSASGYWNNVATVLIELLEEVDTKKLCDLVQMNIYHTTVIQRLGYVLSHPRVNEIAVAEAVYKSIDPKHFRWVPLTPRQKYIEELGPWGRDPTWKILINDDVDPDV